MGCGPSADQVAPTGAAGPGRSGDPTRRGARAGARGGRARAVKPPGAPPPPRGGGRARARVGGSWGSFVFSRNGGPIIVAPRGQGEAGWGGGGLGEDRPGNPATLLPADEVRRIGNGIDRSHGDAEILVDSGDRR